MRFLLPLRVCLGMTLSVLLLGVAGCGSPATVEGKVKIDSTKPFAKTKVLGKSKPPHKPPA